MMEEKKVSPIFDDISNPETIVKHVEDLQREFEEKGNKGVFTVKTANKWIEHAKSQPTPNMLFAEFWHEEEICILFADSNLGKSILAVQIADSISCGKEIKGFRLDAKKQAVLYFDFELNAKQIEARYSEKNEDQKVFENHYLFDDNLLRIEINHDAEIPTETTFEDYLYQSLEQSVIDTGAKILIIDNITYIKTQTERSQDALPLMQYLKRLKKMYGLSILIIAHTPKRDLSRPITQNDLGGSKMLYNFCDSCFAIGQSHADPNLRYIKQVKARNTAIIYNAENIATCELQKRSNFLGFELKGFGTEREHLKVLTENDRESKIEKTKELSQKGYTQRQISAELNISLGTVNKFLKTQ